MPVALYCHETQLTYPDVPGSEPDLSYAFTNWTSVLAADAVAFNSQYHRHAFFAELPRLLRHFPDHTHEHRIPEVAEKSTVLPVGVDLAWVDHTEERRSDPPLILWNHRWEYDKGPEEFFSAVQELQGRGLAFRVAVCGESFRQVPVEFDLARDVLGDRVVWWGFAERDRYRELLRSSDLVVSTAHQEFFGVAVVEAVAAGACPVVPDRLSYPEVLPPDVHGLCLYPPGQLVGRLHHLIESPRDRQAAARCAAAEVRRFDWSAVGPRYDQWISEVFHTAAGRA